jgi:hypothetical protein
MEKAIPELGRFPLTSPPPSAPLEPGKDRYYLHYLTLQKLTKILLSVEKGQSLRFSSHGKAV